MRDLQNRRVIVTGVGIKPVKHEFKDIVSGKPTHTPVRVDGIEYKANIGAAAAYECASAGAIVHMVSRSADKLAIVKRWIEKDVPGAQIVVHAIDLNNPDAMKRLTTELPRDLEIDLVQSVGLSAGTVNLKDDNPYLLIDDLSPELIEAELSVLKCTVLLMQELLPVFRKQKETRVCIVSSMSAIRSVVSGSIHMAAKGAISRFANAAMIELDPERIFITDIRPGIVDTGLYDAEIVQKTVATMGKQYGYDYSETELRCAPPSSVGKAIVTALTSEAHITSINMVARGQWPHEGS